MFVCLVDWNKPTDYRLYEHDDYVSIWDSEDCTVERVRCGDLADHNIKVENLSYKNSLYCAECTLWDGIILFGRGKDIAGYGASLFSINRRNYRVSSFFSALFLNSLDLMSFQNRIVNRVCVVGCILLDTLAVIRLWVYFRDSGYTNKTLRVQLGVDLKTYEVGVWDIKDADGVEFEVQMPFDPAKATKLRLMGI